MTWSLGVVSTKLPAATPTSPKDADQDAAIRKGVWNKVWRRPLAFSERNKLLFAATPVCRARTPRKGSNGMASGGIYLVALPSEGSVFLPFAPLRHYAVHNETQSRARAPSWQSRRVPNRPSPLTINAYRSSAHSSALFHSRLHHDCRFFLITE